MVEITGLQIESGGRLEIPQALLDYGYFIPSMTHYLYFDGGRLVLSDETTYRRTMAGLSEGPAATAVACESIMCGTSCKVSVDDQGRIQIPERLRRVLGDGTDVTVEAESGIISIYDPRTCTGSDEMAGQG